MLSSRVSRAEASRRTAPPVPPRLRPSARPSHAAAPHVGPPALTLGSSPSVSPSPAASIGPGQPLLPAIRAALEPVLEVPLDHVRVHTDPKASEAAKGLGARAFAYGPHILLGSGQSPSNLELMAHEVAHVVQQQVAPAVQRSAPGQSDAHEREAQQASASALRGERYTIRERTTPRVQRWGLSSILNYFADKANLIPGFRMFTIILGVNPVNMSPVQRSAANIMRAVVEFIPGGALITQALDNYGVFDKVGSWVEEQIRTLGMVGSAFKQAIDKFLDSLSLSDALHPGDVWDRAKRIFTEPVDRLINFAKGLITGILKFIKDAILMPLAKLAEGTRGWDLLIAVLGKNPITGEAVPRTAETLIGGFMKLIGQEEVWQNIKKANALARAWAWFQGALDGLLGFVRQIPSLFVQALKSLELADIVLLPRAFLKVGSVFGGFIVQFLTWAGNAVWNLLQIIFEVVAPAVMPYLKKVGAAFKKILQNPIAFVGNLVKAGKQGFQQFAERIGAHLKAAFIDWLTGSLEGVYIPKSFEFREIVKFVLSVLGLTWQNIRQKLVKVLGEPVVKTLETTFDIVVTLVKDGPAAAWEKIKEQLSNLKDMVVQGIMDFIVETVVKKAIAKIIGFLIPGAAFIQAIITIYDTVMVFIDKLKKIAQVVKAFLDSIMDIANGVVTAAANKVESTLAGLLSLAISFLAGFVGLGKVATKVMDIINKKVRQPIDKAIDKVIDWIVTMAKKLVKTAARGIANWWQARKPFQGNDGSKHTLLFIGEGPTARLAFQSDTTELEAFLGSLTGTTPAEKALVAQIKSDIIAVNGLKNTPKNEAAIDAALSRISQTLGQLIGAGRWGSEAQPLPLDYGKPAASAYPVLYFGPKTDRYLPQLELKATYGQSPLTSKNQPRAVYQTILDRLRVSEQTEWAAQNYVVKTYSPTSQQNLPGGRQIGLAGQYQTQVGKKFRLIPGETSGGYKINDALAKYGYDLHKEHTQGDHVLEMQLGGPNDYPNLWPLNEDLNRDGGNSIKNAIMKKPDGKEVKMSEVKDVARTRPVWLFIARTK